MTNNNANLPAFQLKESIDKLITALLDDPDYYYSWQANIAMAFKDEYDTVKERHRIMSPSFQPLDINIHEVANNADKRFLDLLTYIPTELINELSKQD